MRSCPRRGSGAGNDCVTNRTNSDSWRDPGFPQTDRHPVTCVNWEDTQEYLAWLSRRTGAAYRLPSDAEWERAASGSPARGRCGNRDWRAGTCPVGSYGSNTAGLSDMVGNLWEWTSDCQEDDCSWRVIRGGGWDDFYSRPDVLKLNYYPAARRYICCGFRVLRTPD